MNPWRRSVKTHDECNVDILHTLCNNVAFMDAAEAVRSVNITRLLTARGQLAPHCAEYLSS